MNENSIIQYVSKKRTGKTILRKIIAFAALALILILASQIESLREYMIIIAAGCILCGSAFIRNFSVEYEYSVSEDVLTVTSTYGVSKRRTELYAPLSSITKSAPVNTEAAEEITSVSSEFYDFSSSPDAEGRIIFLTEDSIAFILEPNEEIYSALCGGLENDI